MAAEAPRTVAVEEQRPGRCARAAGSAGRQAPRPRPCGARAPRSGHACGTGSPVPASAGRPTPSGPRRAAPRTGRPRATGAPRAAPGPAPHRRPRGVAGLTGHPARRPGAAGPAASPRPWPASASPAGPRPGSRPPPPASVGAHCRRRSHPGGPGARGPPGRSAIASAEYRWFARAAGPHARRGVHERPSVRRGGEREGARAEHDEPRGSQLLDETAEAGAEWGIVGRLPADHGLGRARLEEPAPVMLRQGRARIVEDALERAGVGREGRGEDQDGDRGHRPGV